MYAACADGKGVIRPIMDMPRQPARQQEVCVEDDDV
jgi:hypothetical protein